VAGPLCGCNEDSQNRCRISGRLVTRRCLNYPPTRGKARGLAWWARRARRSPGAIIATTVINLRAAETAASNRTQSRRGTATTHAEAGDKVTTSPRAAPPASARARIFCTAAARGRAGSASPAQRPRRQPRLPASSSSRCSRGWRRRRRMLKTTTTNRSARRPFPRRPSATTTKSRQPPVARRSSAAPHRLAAPRRPSHAAHCWQLFSLCGRTYVR
jgi:hypothetical protein